MVATPTADRQNSPIEELHRNIEQVNNLMRNAGDTCEKLAENAEALNAKARRITDELRRQRARARYEAMIAVQPSYDYLDDIY